MPVTTLSSKNSTRRKNDSGEPNVFKPTRHPSSANENHPGKKSTRRLSLDLPINVALDLESPKQSNKKSHSHKQPSSPGAKLISTLMNSIFSQSRSKKNKPKSGDQTTLGDGRKQRNSTSYFAGNNNRDSKTPTKSSYSELLLKKFPGKSGTGNVNPHPTARIWADDGESDSSSDLFDLPMISNELDFSSGLPVYGTTHVEQSRPKITV